MTDIQRKPNPRFFERDSVGSVRLRIRLSPDDASLIEEAAGETPLIPWIQETLTRSAQEEVDQMREEWPTEPPADDE